jgi:hypothetical protein
MSKRNLKRKPRAKVMLQDIRRLITLRATSSNKKREELAREVLAEIKKRFPKEIPPREETIIKLISKARNHEPSPLEKPWNLGELNNLQKLGIPDISAEAIQRIQEIQVLVSSDNRPPVTIRQAKWVSRLHRLITDNYKLCVVSHFYSTYEIACSVSETPFDTTNIDIMLDDPNRLARFVGDFLINLPQTAIEGMLKVLGLDKQEEEDHARSNNQAR